MDYERPRGDNSYRDGHPDSVTTPPHNRTASNSAQQTGSTQISSGNLVSSSQEKLAESATPSVTLENRDRGDRHSRHADLPQVPRSSEIQELRRARTVDTHASVRGRSAIDWIVPLDEKPIRAKTVGERLQSTIQIAKEQRDKSARKARMKGYLLNFAIGMQVLLGALTTGLSAVATSGRQFALQTTILGGMTTLIASYLARERGSNEPELSTSRVKDLDRFIREVEAFTLDFGHFAGDEHDEKVEHYRKEFEELLGNGSGEWKLSPPA